MNYKGAWGSPQAFFIPQIGQKRVFLGVKLPPTLSQIFEFPPKKVIEKVKKKGTNQLRSVPL